MTIASKDEGAPSAPDCVGCEPLASRRRFLREMFLSAAAALVATGASRASAFAMPLELTEGRRHADDTVSYPIPEADGAQIDKKNDVILVRWQEALYAFNLACPHQNTALHWEEPDHQFQCPKHHSRFEPNGDYIPDSGRATRNMDRFAIVRADNSVMVDLDKLYQADTDTAQWTAAAIKLP
ncbi:MAG: ubiquinol-cytochrome c reductase iron-sulfur subunit [Gemmatimonadales bacterium]